MLLKLQADENVPYVRRLGAKEVIIMWIVQEQLALNHATQVQSLTKALNESPEALATFNISQYAVLDGNGKVLDLSKNPKELGLSGGQQLKLSTAAAVRRRIKEEAQAAAPQSPKQSASPSLAPGSPDLQPSESAVMSPQASQAFSSTAGGQDEEEVTADVAAAAASDEDEKYLAHDVGWFPFTFRTSGGQPVVSFINPFATMLEKDPFPITQDLCTSCSATTAAVEPLPVVVDKHYKPMLLTQDVVEGLVEKLGGGTFQRWQKRFLSISEKSIDWYADQPKQGEKTKICGHHLLAKDGQCLVEVVENPDPAQYPKCSDSRYFHFAFKFSDPVQTTCFRVTTAQEKHAMVSFAKQQMIRLRSKRSNRNPVFWKRWVDSFLVNAGDLGELTTHNKTEASKLQKEIDALEQELAKVTAQRPDAEGLLALKTNVVQQLRRDLLQQEETARNAGLLVDDAEKKVEEQRSLLRLKELEMGDELRKATMLENRMREQKSEAIAKLDRLTRDIAELQREQEGAFARWRKCEEEHDEKLRNFKKPESSNLFTFSVDGVAKAASPNRSSRRLAAAAAGLVSTIGGASPARSLADLGLSVSKSNVPSPSPA